MVLASSVRATLAALPGLLAFADGAAPGAAAIPAAGMGVVFAGALFAVRRSDGLEACEVCEPAFSGVRSLCHSGFAKIVNNATRAANVLTTAIRPISRRPERRRGGGSRTCSGHGANSDIVRRS